MVLTGGHQFQNYEEWKKSPGYNIHSSGSEEEKVEVKSFSSSTNFSSHTNYSEIAFNGKIEFLPAVILQISGRSKPF